MLAQSANRIDLCRHLGGFGFGGSGSRNGPSEIGIWGAPLSSPTSASGKHHRGLFLFSGCRGGNVGSPSEVWGSSELSILLALRRGGSALGWD